ncbi:uncharacterized protein LOC100679339 isoform X1 [Nasonia vitripennis]|uniref:Uncharacterized protein n=1 Tax=Nasonia vitripennis TaxID=7425 RepID=A0A7M7IR72_NASVI|nr:uncharacterized protein LOC100679339 isoform X1 [Nasonia vitripennis]
MQSKTALRSILKKPQSIDDTTTNEGSVPTTTTEETAQSESKPVVERSTTPLESQPAAVDDDSTALLENKPALNNPRVDEEVSNGDVKVLEDVNGRIVKYDPKPRIRKTHMRAIQKKHNIEDGQLLLKFWKYASVQRQMTNLVTSNFLRSKYSTSFTRSLSHTPSSK